MRVVVIGGGTGSFTVLTGLRDYPHLDLYSIVSMMDSGGDSGRLRDEFGVLPPGDLRRCLVALSEETELLRDLLAYRFDEEPLKGRNFGNLLFLALSRSLGSQEESVKAISKILKIRGHVIPVTWSDVHLFARLANGDVVKGEANIDVPKHDASIPIDNVYLDRPATANPVALQAIQSSDAIVIAPGDLYTSTLPNLLVDGVAEAIQSADAPVIYVMNVMTKYGETGGYCAAHHLAEFVRYSDRVPDIVIAHQGDVPKHLLDRYVADRSYPVSVDPVQLYAMGVQSVVIRDLVHAEELVRHDPTRVAAAIVDSLHAATGSKSKSGNQQQDQSTRSTANRPTRLRT